MAKLSVDQRDALQIIKDEFDTYGIGGLADILADLIIKNTNANGDVATSTVKAGLRESPAYKQRFAGNAKRMETVARLKAEGKTVPAGAGPLSEAQYVATEAEYRNVLREYNLPAGFYDDSADFINLIGNDIRPDEVKARASMAQQAASSANPEIKQQLKSLYGVKESQIVSFFLDPEKAQNVIKAGNTAVVAATAQKAGISLTAEQASRVVEKTAPGATDVISAETISANLATTAGLEQASVSGEASSVTGEDVLTAATGDATAEARLKRERSKRQAEYQAASGMAETAKGVVGLQRANL
jgi:hypothetical protein